MILMMVARLKWVHLTPSTLSLVSLPKILCPVIFRMKISNRPVIYSVKKSYGLGACVLVSINFAPALTTP